MGPVLLPTYTLRAAATDTRVALYIAQYRLPD